MKRRRVSKTALLTLLGGALSLAAAGIFQMTPYQEAIVFDGGMALLLLSGIFFLERQIGKELEDRIVNRLQQDDPRAPIGKLDNVYQIHNEISGVRVRGWAFEPGTSESVKIAMDVNGERTGEFVADHERPDVGRSHGVGRFHGFLFDHPLHPGDYDIAVYAISAKHGSIAFLGRQRVHIPADTE